jgi:hypothetical protein
MLSKVHGPEIETGPSTAPDSLTPSAATFDRVEPVGPNRPACRYCLSAGSAWAPTWTMRTPSLIVPEAASADGGLAASMRLAIDPTATRDAIRARDA